MSLHECVWPLQGGPVPRVPLTRFDMMALVRGRCGGVVVHVFGRLLGRFGSPFLVVALAAAILCLTALSIMLQPPATAGLDTLNLVMAWGRAVLFPVGVGGLLLALAGYARQQPPAAPSEGGASAAGEAGELALLAPRPIFERGPLVSRRGGSRAHRARVRVERAPVNRAGLDGDTSGMGEPRYTLIALDASGEEMRAIQDCVGRAALDTVVRRWRQRYPDEQIRVFDAEHVEVERHAARVESPSPAASRPTAVTASGVPAPGLAVGGVR